MFGRASSGTLIEIFEAHASFSNVLLVQTYAKKLSKQFYHNVDSVFLNTLEHN